jgi:glycosyltransferase involved in cell wall biosynthesis
MPKVSIVLPNYNYEHFLDERIQSLLDQTYTDFELIIIDDASKDKSIDLINKYVKDPRVRTQFFQVNSNSTYQRWNDGADMACGDYLMFAGADDSCHPTLLSKLVEKLDENPCVGLAYSQSWLIDEHGDRIDSCKEWTNGFSRQRWEHDYVSRGIDEARFLILGNVIPNASAVLMRTNLFFRIGGFDTQLKVSADWLLYARYASLSDIAYVSENLNYFRRHSNKASALLDKSKAMIEDFKVFNFMYKDLAGVVGKDELLISLVSKIDYFISISRKNTMAKRKNCKQAFKILVDADKMTYRLLFERIIRKIIKYIVNKLRLPSHGAAK